MNNCAGCEHWVVSDVRSNWNGDEPTYIYRCDLSICKEKENESKML